MRALSLFSGIGGDTLAAKIAGIDTVAFCEKDIFCQKVLARHWPDVPIFTDVYELRGDQFEGIDIVYGGFPCQPFSVAGKQKGKDDARHLWPEVARLVGEIKPRWCFFENVPGILNIAADDVCADLERLGYEVGVWNFEAAAVGANHRRARIAFIAHLEHPGIDMLQGVGEQGYSGAESKRRKTFESLRTGCTSTFVAHSGCALRQGSLISGTDGEKAIGGNADIPERPSGASGFVSDSETIYVQGQRDGSGQGEFRGSSRRPAEPRLGRVDDGLPSWLDRDWWRVEPDIPRVGKGIPDRVNRLKALGNAAVPAWAYPIFKSIVESDKEECKWVK